MKSILRKSIALAALGIFLCSNVSFALRPVAFEDRPDDRAPGVLFEDTYPHLKNVPGAALFTYRSAPHMKIHVQVLGTLPGRFNLIRDWVVAFEELPDGSLQKIETPPECLNAIRKVMRVVGDINLHSELAGAETGPINLIWRKRKADSVIIDTNTPGEIAVIVKNDTFIFAPGGKKEGKIAAKASHYALQGNVASLPAALLSAI